VTVIHVVDKIAVAVGAVSRLGFWRFMRLFRIGA
jgi:hypothetical protein